MGGVLTSRRCWTHGISGGYPGKNRTNGPGDAKSLPKPARSDVGHSTGLEPGSALPRAWQSWLSCAACMRRTGARKGGPYCGRPGGRHPEPAQGIRVPHVPLGKGLATTEPLAGGHPAGKHNDLGILVAVTKTPSSCSTRQMPPGKLNDFGICPVAGRVIRSGRGRARVVEVSPSPVDTYLVALARMSAVIRR